MTYLPRTFILGVTRIEELGRDFREQVDPGVDWFGMLWFLVPVVLIGIILVLYRISERASSELREADGLLAELYQAHEFPISARMLCSKIADTCDLSDPSFMLVSPSLFEKAVAKANHTSPLTRRQRETIDWIRGRLFA